MIVINNGMWSCAIFGKSILLNIEPLLTDYDINGGRFDFERFMVPDCLYTARILFHPNCLQLTSYLTNIIAQIFTLTLSLEIHCSNYC